MLRDFLDLFFPHYCLTCTRTLVKGEELICSHCFYDLPQTTCHQELDNIVAQKLYGRIPISRALALYKFRKTGRVQKLLHHLKYKRKPVIGQILGKRYGAILKEARLDQVFDLIVPVPLHRSKLRQRGYNQSDYFAQGLAEILGLPWNNRCLRREKATATQTLKGQLERFENLQNAFQVIDSKAIRDKHLLLVDDVITTGATLEACSTVLLAAGSREISVATIATGERI